MSGIVANGGAFDKLAVSDTLNRLGKHKCKLVHISGALQYLDPAIQDIIGPCDLIIFQRNLVTTEALDVVGYWQGHGKPVAVDLDDSYPTLPWCNPAHAFWIENKTEKPVNPVIMLEEGLRRSNGLIAPNRNLLSDWAHVTKGYYLPNFARSEWWTNHPTREELQQKKGTHGRIVIGWGGSVSHYDSWWGSGIREAATNISRRHPGVLWLICGNDKRIFDQLPVARGSKAWQPGVPPQDWPQTVSSFDIGVAPLYGPYDQRRSWIKGLEYLLGAVPWVGTTGTPYAEIAQLGYLVQNGAEKLEETIEFIIANLSREQERAKSLVPMAQTWFADRQEETYEKTYKEIISNFSIDSGRLAGVYEVNRGQEVRVVRGEVKREPGQRAGEALTLADAEAKP